MDDPSHHQIRRITRLIRRRRRRLVPAPAARVSLELFRISVELGIDLTDPELEAALECGELSEHELDRVNGGQRLVA